MVLTLYAAPGSTCGRRVATTLHEKNVPYKLVVPDMAKNEIKSTEWVSKHPFGQMPFIDDDGFILYESRAIAKYIATKYASSGTPLIPDSSDIKAFALLEQAISVEYSDFDPSASGLVKEKVFKKYFGQEADPAFVAYYETNLTTKMDGFERILSKQKYMSGDKFGLADVFYLPYGEMVTNLGYDFLNSEQKWPNVARWWRDVSTRDSWTTVKDGIPTEGLQA